MLRFVQDVLTTSVLTKYTKLVPNLMFNKYHEERRFEKRLKVSEDTTRLKYMLKTSVGVNCEFGRFIKN